MTGSESLLFIGGPLDGEYKKTNTFTHVAVVKDSSWWGPVSSVDYIQEQDFDPSRTIQVKHVVYKRNKFTAFTKEGGERIITVMAEESLSSYDIMLMLLERYSARSLQL